MISDFLISTRSTVIYSYDLNHKPIGEGMAGAPVTAESLGPLGRGMLMWLGMSVSPIAQPSPTYKIT